MLVSTLCSFNQLLPNGKKLPPRLLPLQPLLSFNLLSGKIRLNPILTFKGSQIESQGLINFEEKEEEEEEEIRMKKSNSNLLASSIHGGGEKKVGIRDRA